MYHFSSSENGMYAIRNDMIYTDHMEISVVPVAISNDTIEFK